MSNKRVVRCKMILQERNERRSGAGNEKVVGLKFQVVGAYTKTDLTPEDLNFFKWTPYGTLEFGTVNYDAAEGMELGTEYYIDVIPASTDDA